MQRRFRQSAGHCIHQLRLLAPNILQGNLPYSTVQPDYTKAAAWVGHCHLVNQLCLTAAEHVQIHVSERSFACASRTRVTTPMQLLFLHAYVPWKFQHIKAFTGCLSQGDELHWERFPRASVPPIAGR